MGAEGKIKNQICNLVFLACLQAPQLPKMGFLAFCQAPSKPPKSKFGILEGRRNHQNWEGRVGAEGNQAPPPFQIGFFGLFPSSELPKMGFLAFCQAPSKPPKSQFGILEASRERKGISVALAFRGLVRLRR